MPRPKRICGVGSVEVNRNRGDRLNDRKEGQGQFSYEAVIQVPSYLQARSTSGAKLALSTPWPG